MREALIRRITFGHLTHTISVQLKGIAKIITIHSGPTSAGAHGVGERNAHDATESLWYTAYILTWQEIWMPQTNRIYPLYVTVIRWYSFYTNRISSELTPLNWVEIWNKLHSSFFTFLDWDNTRESDFLLYGKGGLKANEGLFQMYPSVFV